MPYAGNHKPSPNGSKSPSNGHTPRSPGENRIAGYQGDPYDERPESTNRKFKGGSNALEEIKRAYKSHYYFSDDDVIDVVLGIVAGNHFDSDPAWLHLISAPSGGKTELLNSIQDCDEAYFLSDFTAASLISGYKDPTARSKTAKADPTDGESPADDDEAEDYSLLPQLDGKVVVTKDFSIIHDKPSETRAQILSILRDVYDGYASRALGNSKSKGFHARFNYLTGMTPDIEKSWSLNTLGERFLMYRIQIADRRAHARQSLKNANSVLAIRNALKQKVKAFLAAVPKDIVPAIDDGMVERVLDLADLLSTCRTYVHRERNDEMTFLPLAELASRVAKQLLRIGQSVALVRGESEVTDAEFKVMKRIALDSLPTNRLHMLKALWAVSRVNKMSTIDSLMLATGLAKTTAKRLVSDLEALKVVQGKLITVEGTKNVTRKCYYSLTPLFAGYCRTVGGL